MMSFVIDDTLAGSQEQAPIEILQKSVNRLRASALFAQRRDKPELLLSPSHVWSEPQSNHSQPAYVTQCQVRQTRSE